MADGSDGAALPACDAIELQHDPQRDRDLSHILLAFSGAFEQAANRREVNFARYRLGRCFSTRIRTSASVASSMTPGTVTGRGNGCDQSGAGNGIGSSRKTLRYYRRYKPASRASGWTSGNHRPAQPVNPKPAL